MGFGNNLGIKIPIMIIYFLLKQLYIILLSYGWRHILLLVYMFRI